MNSVDQNVRYSFQPLCLSVYPSIYIHSHLHLVLHTQPCTCIYKQRRACICVCTHVHNSSLCSFGSIGTPVAMSVPSAQNSNSKYHFSGKRLNPGLCGKCYISLAHLVPESKCSINDGHILKNQTLTCSSSQVPKLGQFGQQNTQ